MRLSLAGAQPKLPVVLEDGGRAALPGNSATPTTHILKPEPERFPGLVDNEAVCMALARACGLVAADTRAAVTATGMPVLVVERYDRDLPASQSVGCIKRISARRSASRRIASTRQRAGLGSPTSSP